MVYTAAFHSGTVQQLYAQLCRFLEMDYPVQKAAFLNLPSVWHWVLFVLNWHYINTLSLIIYGMYLDLSYILSTPQVCFYYISPVPKECI